MATAAVDRSAAYMSVPSQGSMQAMSMPGVDFPEMQLYTQGPPMQRVQYLAVPAGTAGTAQLYADSGNYYTASTSPPLPSRSVGYMQTSSSGNWVPAGTAAAQLQRSPQALSGTTVLRPVLQQGQAMLTQQHPQAGSLVQQPQQQPVMQSHVRVVQGAMPYSGSVGQLSSHGQYPQQWQQQVISTSGMSSPSGGLSQVTDLGSNLTEAFAGLTLQRVQPSSSMPAVSVGETAAGGVVLTGHTGNWQPAGNLAASLAPAEGNSPAASSMPNHTLATALAPGAGQMYDLM